MDVSLFKALKSIKIADESATLVVDDMRRCVESVVNNNIQAVYGELTALRGELKGLAAGMEALKHQVTLTGILIGIVGLAIAAGPIVAKFIH